MRLPRAVIVASLFGGVVVASAQVPQHAFPSRIERYLETVVRLSPEQRRELLAGRPVARLLTAEVPDEVAVFGAVWIGARIDDYVQRLQDIEQFERGAGFTVTRRISAPPVRADFDRMRLPDEDVRDLRDCRVDDCEVKLGEQAMRRFQAEVDWKVRDPRPAVDSLMRQLAFEYVTGYLARGNSALAVYRDRGRPRSVADEFHGMVERMPEFSLFPPDLRRYLVEYPAVTLPESTSFLYWQETEFGLKPTIRISHVTIRQRASETVVASKMLYATHYFWTGLELRLLLPDPARGDGFWLVTASRSRSDGLSGFLGSFVRRRVRSQVLQGTLTVLRTTKQKLE